MLAVIKTGGKQYIVTPGQKIKVEKLDAKEGSEVAFPEVLLLENEGKIDIGSPFVSGAKVTGKAIEHGRGEKLIVFKYKAKKRYHLKKGHRQAFSLVEITKIETK